MFYNTVMPVWDPKTLPPYTVPGFDPGQDRFPIPNTVDVCAGMTYFAAWYWENHSSSKRLVNRYGIGESVAIASEAQELTSAVSDFVYWDNEQRDIYEIIEDMRRTQRPVPVSIRTEVNLPGKRFFYHSVLAYSWTGTRLLCLDPNSAVRCPLAVPREAEIYGTGGNNWEYMSNNGTTIYEDVSKDTLLDKFYNKLNNIYNKYLDLSVEITLDGVTNDAGESGPFHPGSYIVLDFNIRVQGHGITVEAWPVTAFLEDDYSSSLISISDPHPYTPVPLAAKIGDNHIECGMMIPEGAPSGEYAVFTKLYSPGVCYTELLRDVTGNGPNSGLQAGMNIPAFEVISEAIEIPQPVCITFPDQALEQAIREAINKPTGDIYDTDLAGLTYLSAEDRGIADLAGMQYCANPTMLYLSGNQISDVTPLAGLINLTGLGLSRNQISDITPLAGLINLTGLRLNDNQISDIAPLAGLINLTMLQLDNNQIRDIAYLAGLTNLTVLGLSDNQISNIIPLARLTKLTMLLLNWNQISSISALSGLTDLAMLKLGNNQISAIAPLARLTNLTELSVYRNQISDISALSGLTNLTYLQLFSNQISAIAPLARLINLTMLCLSDNQVSNISALSGLINLTDLQLWTNQISDIQALVDNAGLGVGDKVGIGYNYLDLTPGSPDMLDIEALQGRGVDVEYRPQN